MNLEALKNKTPHFMQNDRPKKFRNDNLKLECI